MPHELGRAASETDAQKSDIVATFQILFNGPKLSLDWKSRLEVVGLGEYDFDHQIGCGAVNEAERNYPRRGTALGNMPGFRRAAFGTSKSSPNRFVDRWCKGHLLREWALRAPSGAKASCTMGLRRHEFPWSLRWAWELWQPATPL